MNTCDTKVTHGPVYTRTYNNLGFRWKDKEMMSAENKLRVLKHGVKYVQCILYYQKEFPF